jgi:hypothetical protein
VCNTNSWAIFGRAGVDLLLPKGDGIRVYYGQGSDEPSETGVSVLEPHWLELVLGVLIVASSQGTGTPQRKLIVCRDSLDGKVVATVSRQVICVVFGRGMCLQVILPTRRSQASSSVPP